MAGDEAAAAGGGGAGAKGDRLPGEAEGGGDGKNGAAGELSRANSGDRPTNTGFDLRSRMSSFSQKTLRHAVDASESKRKPVELDRTASLWNRVACACFDITEGKYEVSFQIAGMIAILTAAALAGVKEELGDAPWITAVEWIVTVLFTAEAIVRFCGSGVAYPPLDSLDEAKQEHEIKHASSAEPVPFEVFLVESKPVLYFRNPWNVFDLLVVIICYIPDAGAAGMVLRLLRVLRMLRLLHMVPQLQLIVKGLTSGLSSIFIILLLLFLVLYMYSIVGIVLFQENDPTHFRTLDTALLSMFRVVTGEDWTDVMYINWFGCAKYGYASEHVDENFRCTRNDALNAISPIYFISLMLIGSLVMLSLFIGVISTSMNEESEKYAASKKLARKLKGASAKRGRVLSKPKIREACEACFSNDLARTEKLLDEAEMDDDSDYQGEPNSEGTPRGMAMKLGRMITSVRKSVGTPRSGTISTVKTIHRIHREMEGKSDLVKKYAKFAHKLERVVNSNAFAYATGVVISLASLLVGLRTYDSLSNDVVVSTIDDLCLYYFTVEIVAKMVSYGLTPLQFFSDSWNIFDLLVVILSYIFAKAKVVRVVRLLRIPKLAKSFPQIQIILEGLIRGFGSVGYILLLVFMEFYMYAIIGMALFKENDPWHFSGIGRTFVTLFRCATLEDWTDVMYINIYGCRRYPENSMNDGSGYTALVNGTTRECTHKAHGFTAALYFVSFIVIGSMVTLSLFIGVVTNAMQETSDEFIKREAAKKQVKKVIRRFDASVDDANIILRVFNLFDMDSEGTIDTDELAHVLQMVGHGVKRSDAEAIMKTMDVDATGDVSGAEFLEMIFIVHGREWQVNREKKEDKSLTGQLAKSFTRGIPRPKALNLAEEDTPK